MALAIIFFFFRHAHKLLVEFETASRYLVLSANSSFGAYTKSLVADKSLYSDCFENTVRWADWQKLCESFFCGVEKKSCRRLNGKLKTFTLGLG